ncbi:radical SAM/SPASM domain-containing protein [Candidatus Parcubacteria bacterium]|nr:MAG: radical SAM/SPASM domain-containing protein [Candidatus Parcubacteria bacterium]
MASQRMKEIILLLPNIFQEKIVKYYLKSKTKQIQQRQTPSTLIFFVTSRCNAQCAHCFYWQELNTSPDELGLAEIKKIAASLKHPLNLSLTGGEPFLRNDLLDICRIFYEQNQCRNIGMASNGFLSDKVIATTVSIITELPLESLSVQISLDGLAKTHNAIRGVKDGYSKALKTIAALAALSKQHQHFKVSVSFTIQKRNINEVIPIIDLLIPHEVPIKFALVRGKNSGTYALPQDSSSEIDPKENDSPIVDTETLKDLFRQIKEKNEAAPYRFWSVRQQEKIRLSIKMMEEKKKQLPCYAGKIDGVLYANGNVALCELTRPIGNIKDFDYDFKQVWSSEQAEKMRGKIQKCFCIHGCNLTTSMMFNPKIILSSLKKP